VLCRTGPDTVSSPDEKQNRGGALIVNSDLAGDRTRSRSNALLSIVVPMYNEAGALEAFFTCVDAAIARTGAAAEIICVDDGSRDDTLRLLTERAAGDSRIKVIALARNFGKEAALSAGLQAARGQMIVPIDADLQDPPELIPEFVRLWETGYDVVYGVRVDRSSDQFLKRITASSFYGLFNLISDFPIPSNAGDYRLMDRKVVDAVNRLPERNRFTKGLFAWVGFSQVGVPFTRPQRAGGKSTQGYLALTRLALDGTFSFSTAPLRVWTSVGLAAGGVAALYGCYLILRVLFTGREVHGYASLMVAILFAFALQMVALGVLGEYVGRLYSEAKGRPNFIVDRRIGFDD
jgi:glycosyltransferase involved in cell wall biosynthesis